MPKLPSPSQGLTPANPFPADCAERFERSRLLGEGGYGAVYLATQRSLSRPVAVKVLLRAILQDTEQVARFVNEARVTATLSHPHIVRLIDHGAEEGVPWIAYEYLPGRTLRDILETRELAATERMAALAQVMDAVQAAHDAGVLHRDLKPDNVIEVEPGNYKVTDFGIAKWAGGSAVKTDTGVVMGTPAYLAPEQVLGDAASEASDQYALGVMMFELLAGQLPYRDENPILLLERHSRAEIPPLGVAGLPPALEAIVRKAMAKRPGERFGSVRQMRAELDRALAAWTGAEGVRAPAGARPESGELSVTRPDEPGRRRATRPDEPSRGRSTRPVRPAAHGDTVAMAPGGGRGRALAATVALVAIAAALFALRGREPERTTASPAAPSASATSPAPAPLASSNGALITRAWQVTRLIQWIASGYTLSLVQVRTDVPGRLWVFETPVESIPARREPVRADRAGTLPWRRVAGFQVAARARLVHRLEVPWNDTSVDRRYLKLTAVDDPAAPALLVLPDQRLSDSEWERRKAAVKTVRRAEAEVRAEMNEEQVDRLVHPDGVGIASDLEMLVRGVPAPEPPLPVERLLPRLDHDTAERVLEDLAHRTGPRPHAMMLDLLAQLLEGGPIRSDEYGRVDRCLDGVSTTVDEATMRRYWGIVRTSGSVLRLDRTARTLSNFLAADDAWRRELAAEVVAACRASPLTEAEDKLRLAAIVKAIWWSCAADRLELLAPAIRHPGNLPREAWLAPLTMRDPDLARLYEAEGDDPHFAERCADPQYAKLLKLQRQDVLLDRLLRTKPEERAEDRGHGAAMACAHVTLTPEARGWLARRASTGDAAALVAQACQVASGAPGAAGPQGSAPPSAAPHRPSAERALALAIERREGNLTALKAWAEDAGLGAEVRATAAFGIAWRWPDAWPEVRAKIEKGAHDELLFVLAEIKEWRKLEARPELAPVAGTEAPGTTPAPAAFVLGAIAGELEAPVGMWTIEYAWYMTPKRFGWWRDRDGKLRSGQELPDLALYPSSLLNLENRHPFTGPNERERIETVVRDRGELIVSIEALEKQKVQTPRLIWGVLMPSTAR